MNESSSSGDSAEFITNSKCESDAVGGPAFVEDEDLLIDVDGDWTMAQSPTLVAL